MAGPALPESARDEAAVDHRRACAEDDSRAEAAKNALGDGVQNILDASIEAVTVAGSPAKLAKLSKKEKRAIKKEKTKQNRQDRRHVKHQAAHDAVLEIVRGRGIEEAFGPITDVTHSETVSLELNGETLSAACITQRLFERPRLYAEKYGPQELPLVGKVIEVLRGDLQGAAVLDIGAGNANLAALTSLILGIPVFCLDKETPRDELRAENFPLPPDVRLVRVEADIADFTQADLQALCDRHQVCRVVFVGKHLCGLGTDLAIEFVHRLASENTPVVGCIFATCCWNKIPYDGGGQQYVDMYRACGCLGNLRPGEASDARIIEAMGKSTSWKCAAQSDNNVMTAEMVACSHLHEALLQVPRKRRLDQIFPPCQEDYFVPEVVTLQNRCLVAPGGFDYRPAFACLLKKALNRADVPVLLKPKGLVSKKFDYDGT